MGKGGEKVQNVETVKRSRKISLEELSAHRTPNDAWVSYRNKVYDISNWNDHPGGSVIFTHAGDDCTDIFAAFHPSTATQWLEKFEIGVLDESIIPSGLYANKLKPEQQKEFERGYRELRAQILKAGLFNANIGYYIYKIASNLLIAAVAAACAMYSNSFAVQMIGAVIMGLFWQQCGWLAHDFLHHQVFKTRAYGDLMGVVVGNLFQGFSVQWWKTKHNSHHAVPNLEASTPDSADGDPDIDTMPILAWTLRMAKLAENSPFGRFMIAHQALFYFPVLLLARISWAHQSWVYVFGGYGQHSIKLAEMDRKKMAYPVLEKVGLLGHYACLLYILSYMPVVNAICYFLVASCSCGLFLATVFGLGHNGMSVYPANQRPDFWKLQVTTTRNVASNVLVDWFCGGLQYQVDHHLFPMIPRHNLAKVHTLVESFCKEHNVHYHEADMWVGTKEVLNHLAHVSKEFAEQFPAM